MTSTHWTGILASGLISLSAIAGCSGDPEPTNNGTAGTGAGTTAGTAGTGTTGGTGGTGGGTAATGTRLTGTAAYTILTGGDATAATTAAPSAYVEQCQLCHQANGEGSTIAPEIRHITSTYATAIVRNGRKDYMNMPTLMVAFPATTVADADLTAMLAWLQALPRPTTGQGLYKDFCGNCHGPNMPTGGAVPFAISGFPMAEVSTDVRTGFGTDPSARDAYMPAFSTTDLTDAELALIQTYIGSK